MFLGRTAECDRLRALIERARRGESGALVITGEAGIGKTALLCQATESAVATVRLSTRGVEAETDLPYVGLTDLFLPVAHLIQRVPERQASALIGALALGPAVAGDRFAVSAGTLSLLGVLGEQGPVLITVDDAQWLDTFSLEALAFATRRLSREGVIVLFTIRDGDEQTARRLTGLDVLTLGGLDPDTARRLLSAAPIPELAASSLERLIMEAAGNPLALIELPTLLNERELLECIRGSRPLPVGDALANAFGGAVAALPHQTRDALLLLAILGTAPPEVIATAFERAHLRLGSLEPAEAAGLVVYDDGGFSFRHPLIRAAAHRNATGAQRRRAHATIADALERSTSPEALERRAWHLAAAGAEPDSRLAAELENAAEDALARLNSPLAARLHERAGQFTPPGDDRAVRFTKAGMAFQVAGAADESALLLDKAAEHATDPRLLMDIRHLRHKLDIWRGEAVHPCAALVTLADEAVKVDPLLAAVILGDATLSLVRVGDVRQARQTSIRAEQLASGAEFPILPVHLFRALVLLLSGDTEVGCELLDGLADALADVDPLSPRQELLVAGTCYLSAERLDQAHETITRAASLARNCSALGVLPFQLTWLATAEYWRGQWSRALASAHEAVSLSQDSWATCLPTSLAELARIEAGLGRARECQEHARLAIEKGEAAGLSTVVAQGHAALGLLKLGQGQLDEAEEHLQTTGRFSQEQGVVNNPLLFWASDLVETYTRLGRYEEAKQTFSVLEEDAHRGDRPIAAGAAARCQGLLDPDAAEQHMAAALRLHSRRPVPFEQARTQLCLGENFRRKGRRVEARKWLVPSLRTFERLGAADWAARTRAELHAAGGPKQQAERVGPACLTPQELQVALTVAKGGRNQEVAAELFLSVKTVEFHLSNTYRKLGINRRTQLIRLFAEE